MGVVVGHAKSTAVDGKLYQPGGLGIASTACYLGWSGVCMNGLGAFLSLCKRHRKKLCVQAASACCSLPMPPGAGHDPLDCQHHGASGQRLHRHLVRRLDGEPLNPHRCSACLWVGSIESECQSTSPIGCWLAVRRVCCHVCSAVRNCRAPVSS